MPTLFTVGHSNRSLDALVTLLRDAGVRCLVDVRRYPASRRHPQFASASLEAKLRDHDMAYRHVPELGGYRKARPDSPHRALEPGFRGYADHMETRVFAAALDDLERGAGDTPTTVLCAEADPGRCHRGLLADALVRDGFRVVHLLAPGESRDHRPPAILRREGSRLVYDGGVLPLDFGTPDS